MKLPECCTCKGLTDVKMNLSDDEVWLVCKKCKKNVAECNCEVKK